MCIFRPNCWVETNKQHCNVLYVPLGNVETTLNRSHNHTLGRENGKVFNSQFNKCSDTLHEFDQESILVQFIRVVFISFEGMATRLLSFEVSVVFRWRMSFFCSVFVYLFLCLCLFVGLCVCFFACVCWIVFVSLSACLIVYVCVRTCVSVYKGSYHVNEKKLFNAKATTKNVITSSRPFHNHIL